MRSAKTYPIYERLGSSLALLCAVRGDSQCWVREDITLRPVKRILAQSIISRTSGTCNSYWGPANSAPVFCRLCSHGWRRLQGGQSTVPLDVMHTKSNGSEFTENSKQNARLRVLWGASYWHQRLRIRRVAVQQISERVIKLVLVLSL